MRAAYATTLDPNDPLAGLVVGEIGDERPDVPADWVPIRVRAASLNHHDLWSLRGVGLRADRLPMVLGCDAAGETADGAEVIVHAVIGSAARYGDETLDPDRSLLSERYPGTLAPTVWVPPANVVPKPVAMSWEVAACMPTSWLTAYRMLFGQGELKPGETVLVQGAGGGVASALVQLGAAAGLRMWVTSRSPERGARAVALGAADAFPVRARLPERVDAVMETVGAATWSHSLKALRPGGRVVICGATSGGAPGNAELNRVFFTGLRVLGTTMGTIGELRAVTAFVDRAGLVPAIDRVIGLDDVEPALAAMDAGATFGKVVVHPGD
ncbi:MAG TPA: zinc-binding dehydrogenase [Actinopolymorphaceae bacterium]|jgi:NADPH:quinone reductase-like Zn-dependent oxidoreductase